MKIKRAEKHINDLSNKIDSFLAEHPFSVVRVFKPELGKVSLRTKADKVIPDELSLIIGDAAHNLRAALDLIMFAMAKDRSPSPDRIEFPFPRKAEGLESAINSAQVKFAGTKVADAVRALKPHPNGNEILYGLHRLDVRDKHHVLVLSRHIADISADAIGRLLGVPVFGPGIIRYAGPEDGDIVVANADFGHRHQRRALIRRHGSEWEEKTGIQSPVNIAFGEGEPFSGELVVSVLNNCRDMVNESITALIAAFSDPDNRFST